MMSSLSRFTWKKTGWSRETCRRDSKLTRNRQILNRLHSAATYWRKNQQLDEKEIRDKIKGRQTDLNL